MNATILDILLAAAGRSAEQGTLFESIETAIKLARLVEPLLDEAEHVERTAETTTAPRRQNAR